MISLACVDCDREDWDGACHPRHEIHGDIRDGRTLLRKARLAGWIDISRDKVGTESKPHPRWGEDLTAWWTHLGRCPDCATEVPA